MQSHIIGIRFTKTGKTYHFDSSDLPDVAVGEHVIVDTARGKHLGEIIQRLEESPPQPKGGWKKVLRHATPRDLLLAQTWRTKEVEAMVDCREKASQMKLEGIKIIKAEFNYDGSRLTYLYSSEGDKKVNLNDLRKKCKMATATQKWKCAK